MDVQASPGGLTPLTFRVYQPGTEPATTQVNHLDLHIFSPQYAEGWFTLVTVWWLAYVLLIWLTAWSPCLWLFIKKTHKVFCDYLSFAILPDIHASLRIPWTAGTTCPVDQLSQDILPYRHLLRYILQRRAFRTEVLILSTLFIKICL